MKKVEMNGPSSIYRLKPAFKLPEKIEVPTCVYHLNKIQGVNDVMKSEKPACGDGPVYSNILEQEPLPELTALQTRWDKVFQQLNDLRNQMTSIKTILKAKSVINTSVSTIELSQFEVLQGAVINASVQHPPYSLLLIQRLYRNTIPISFSCHVHSSVKILPESVNSFKFLETSSQANSLHLILVWKEGILDTQLVTNPVKQIPIQGEVNLLRLFARLGLTCLRYDEDETSTIYNDSILDICHRLAHVRTVKEKQSLIRALNARLGKSSYYGGEDINVCDIGVWSVLKQIEINVTSDLTQNMSKWFNRIENKLSN